LSLPDLEIQEEYRSDRCNLIKDFYIPCLEQSTTYFRAVGFFSSTSMAAVSAGLTAFIRSGGRMFLVTSPQLSDEDVEAIARGLQQREEIIANALVRELEQDVEEVMRDRFKCLAWLLAKGLLDIRLAIPKNIRYRGIYHEKLGIFQDAEENVVAFTGSANESSAALIGNFECIDVFWSWEPALQSRVFGKLKNFQQLWNNQTSNLEVLEFPEAARRSLLRLCPNEPPQEDWELTSQGWTMQSNRAHYDVSSGSSQASTGIPLLPMGLVLRPYQQEAIANWFNNNGRGTLKMATGSGKTITALAIAAELHKNIQLQAVIIVCPYRHLVSQWARECGKFGINDPILAFESVSQWQGRLSNQLYNVKAGNQRFLAVITTNATLMTAGFQSQLPYFPKKTLIVGDEAHNLGARRLADSLPRTVGLRLALSATPERYFDDQGTEALLDYFGAVLQPEFTLGDAIRQGALVRYRYYPVLVELTEAEMGSYLLLTKRIGRAIALGENPEDNEGLTALLNQRARLVGAAANKLEALREVMRSRLHTSHTLFYCGDGSVEDATSAESQRQLEAVARLLGRELGYRVNTYTAETSLEEREDLRQQFEHGDLQGLVAIRCLDEGVDIPAIETAVILASSGNPRQFIQRRGRVLRPHSRKERATIFDMIVLPPELGGANLEVERNFLRKELARFVEFADLADNAGEARVRLLDLQRRYDLLDV